MAERPLGGAAAAFVYLDCGFDAVHANGFTPCFEACLEGNNAGFWQRDFDGFEDLCRGRSQVQGYTDVALDVALGGPHHGEAGDEDQFFGFVVQGAL